MKRPSHILFWIAAAALFLTTGCSMLPKSSALTPAFQPDNIYKLATVLPVDLKRVAVLPVASGNQTENFLAGCETVEPIVTAELIKTKRFEVVAVSGRTMTERTGRASWKAAESLPENFLSSVRRATGCDAILFTELTEYRPYAPVAIGWRLKLVDARTGLTLWAGDELFDAQNSEVVAAVRHVSYLPTIDSFLMKEADWAVLHSPRLFAQYSVAQVFGTLPVR
jgi:hypothetical protein